MQSPARLWPRRARRRDGERAHVGGHVAPPRAVSERTRATVVSSFCGLLLAFFGARTALVVAGHGREEKPRAVGTRYAVGTRQTAWYDPADPTVAVLVGELDCLALALLGCLLPTLLLAVHRRRRLRSAPRRAGCGCDRRHAGGMRAETNVRTSTGVPAYAPHARTSRFYVSGRLSYLASSARTLTDRRL